MAVRLVALGTCAPLDDVCYRTGKHLEPFRHLQCNHRSPILSDVVDGFMDLEGVVGGKLFDSSVDLFVLKYFWWYLIAHDVLDPRL